MNHYNILSLLPYSETSELINKKQKLDDLYFIKSIVDIGLMALEGFTNGNLSLFDAQVGENLCQIRAYNILHLGEKYLTSDDSKEVLFKEIDALHNYKNKLENVIVQWEDAVTHSHAYNKSLDGAEHINDFIDRHKLHINLNEDCVFIITCFFLSHFSIRNEGIPAAINLNFISRELHISKYRSKRLTHKYQLLVCQLGCQFVMTIASDLHPTLGYPSILPKLYQISDEDRMVLPCHIASEVVFHHAIYKRKPLLFIINRINANNEIIHVLYFLLIGHPNKMEFLLVNPTDYLQEHCMVVFGVVQHDVVLDDSLTNYVRHVLSETPLKLILANTASHPQYSGKRLEEFKHNPYLLITTTTDLECEFKIIHAEKLLSMQLFAEHNGCSKTNPSTFLLKHVYANKVNDEINRLKEIHQNCVHDAHIMMT